MKDEENEKEMETKEKQSMSMKKKWVTLVSMAVVFGLIAGGVMYGVNAAGNRLYAQSHIANTDTLSDADEVSSDSTDNGSASVEEVTKDAMPSLVTISTMSVEEMRNFFGGTQKYEVEGAGTGVIVGEKSLWLNNAERYPEMLNQLGQLTGALKGKKLADVQDQVFDFQFTKTAR